MVKKRGRPTGYKMSQESKDKISAKLKGRKLSDEHREKIAKAMLNNNNNRLNGRKGDREVEGASLEN